jgi:two-component system, LytTR family, response regulator
MIRALIVDDELKSINVLNTLINEHCSDIEIAATCTTIQDAKEAVEKHKPQLVFLDVEMPRENGFQLINYFSEKKHFEIIFVTAYESYALQAIKVSAVDFILKPVTKEELIKAVDKAINKIQSNTLDKNWKLLVHNLNSEKTSQLIGIPTAEGLTMVKISDIIYCESSNNFTIINTINKQQHVVTRHLVDYEELLEPFGFLRVHNSFLINMNQITRYVKGRGGEVLMSDGKRIEVSSRKKVDFLTHIFK